MRPETSEVCWCRHHHHAQIPTRSPRCDDFFQKRPARNGQETWVDFVWALGGEVREVRPKVPLIILNSGLGIVVSNLPIIFKNESSTLYEANKALENRPSQKKNHLPTQFFAPRYRFCVREGGDFFWSNLIATKSTIGHPKGGDCKGILPKCPYFRF